jgi:hypothetical protein
MFSYEATVCQVFLEPDRHWLLLCGIFCDLTKAFHTVNHDILIAKLEYYGIVGRTRELIKSYLSNRYQRVTIKSSHASNYTSAFELVKHGVPQGSILGPLLFLVYKMIYLS